MAKQISFLLLLLTLGLFYSLIEAIYITPPCNDANWYCRYKSRAETCDKMEECYPKDDVKKEKMVYPDHTSPKYAYYNGAGFTF